MKRIAELFNIEGEILEVVPHGGGYINDTYAVSCQREDGSKVRYILQRINHDIFKNPEALMDNFVMVCDYLKNIVKEQGGDPSRETLTVINTRDGQNGVWVDGNYYRMLLFIEDTVCYDICQGPEDFYKCAKAFGNFQFMLKDFPADKLTETIPNFHNTPVRFQTFLKAVEENKSGRAHLVQDEINFILERKVVTDSLIDLLNAGELPLKVTHNDTKLSNILMDAKTNDSLCVIDLDTIMPGLAAYDFGDSIRAGACYTAEDETDLSKVYLVKELFEAYVKGFIEGSKKGLTAKEIETLPIGAKVITLEQGIRFLTDYLDGDLYYKTQYADHNLDRTRTQLKLVADMEDKWEEITKIIEKYSV